jgi:histidyl-tRNA synthetase
MSKTQGPLSGFRDLLAQQMLARDVILDKIKAVYELYGFVPLKTPALELDATLRGKYGEEGDKLMYAFEDNGGRKVAMRYDQTVPLARIVANYSAELPKPYKRYAIGDVWRGESPQAGRYREFTQFDADIVGSADISADIEIIAMICDSMKSIGASAIVSINDRRLFDCLAKICGIATPSEFTKLVTTIDKIDKIGKLKVLQEVEKIIGETGAKIVDTYLSLTGNSLAKLKELPKLLDSKVAQETISQLTSIIESLNKAGYGESQVVFDQTIARGLSYYTGTIFETKLTDLPIIGSVCSGGRFDNLIEQLGGPATPAIGTSIGIDRLLEGLGKLDLLSSMRTKTKVYITNLDPALDEDRFIIAQKLRVAGIATEMIYANTRLKNQLRDIDKLGVAEVLIYGSQEKQKKIFVAKNLDNQTQIEVPLDNLVDYYQKIIN